MNTKEYAVQNALGTLRIFEIWGEKNTDAPFFERYPFERWVKAPTAATALILALQEDPTLVDFTLTTMERTQEEADDWIALGPFTIKYYKE